MREQSAGDVSDVLKFALPPVLAASERKLGLDRLRLNKIRPPDLRNRLYFQHPKPGSLNPQEAIVNPIPGGPIGCR